MKARHSFKSTFEFISWVTTVINLIVSAIIWLVPVPDKLLNYPSIVFLVSHIRSIPWLVISAILVAVLTQRVYRARVSLRADHIFLFLFWQKIWRRTSPDIFWLIKMRVRHVLRVVANGTTGAVVVLVAPASLFIPLYSYYLFLVHPPLLRGVLLGVTTVLFMVLLSFLVAYQALYKLPPERYTQITISGEEFSTVLRMISFEIWVVCFRFENHLSIRYLESLIPTSISEKRFSPATLIPDLAGARSQIESHIEVLNKYVVAQQWPLQRMQVMKHLASREFGIPPTRFCDYIVQFSPEIYNKRIRKYVKNWEEILETIDAEHPMDRMKALMAENKSIYADIYKRRLYQEQILTFKDLHQHIHDFAREHSTSASIKNYVKALSAVAATVMKSYQGESFVRSPLYTIVCKKLEFLYYKQRVHPGFDLHRAAIQLFKLDTQRHDSICSRSSDHVDMLERFHVGANGAFVSHEEHKAHSELQNLAAMFMDMIEILSANREELIANFKDAYLRWIGREDESVDFQSSHYILTHGYSRTVRETIKYGLRPLIAESDSHNRPRVYIIKSSDEDAIDTRLMEFELRQNVLNENEGQSPLEIMSADESVLLDLFGPHSHVLLVLGTEAYDQKCHVIHPRGIRLRELRTAIQKTGAHCTVMIVAEGYKCHDNLLEIQEFYQHHLDRIAINGAGQVDEVVSTNGLGIRNNLSDIHPKGYHNGVPVS